MQDYFKEHRFLDKIDNGIKKGNALFFMYGKANNDYFLFDFNNGIKEIHNSLFLYFYNIQKVDAFCIIKNSKIQFVDKNGEQISASKALEIKKESTGFGEGFNEMPNSDSKNTNSKATEATQELSGDTAFENSLIAIEKAFDDKKIGIYFDEFEWLANLYGSEKKLDLIKKIRNWNKSKKSFTIVNIKEPDLLNEFHFDIDEASSNMIFVGNPSQKEIYKAYKRYIHIHRSDIKILEEDFDYIVSAIQSSQKNLRESMRVLKTILQNCPQNSELKKELFESAIHKKIEEKIKLDDVILDTKTKNEILNNVKTFHTDKENSKKGIMLYGPPGTGKTYIAKAIANEYNMNFMAPKLSDLKGEYIGQTSGKVKRLFEEARANAPTVIFLDEIDTIFPKRDGADTDSYLKDMVNQFLVEIDGASTGKQDIFIIGATNRLEVIDSAIRSRLSTEFKISLPDETNRELIFDSKFKQFKLSQQTWKQQFLMKTEGMSGRDIENFAKSIKQIVDNDESKITEDIFFNALDGWEEKFVNDFKMEMKNSIHIHKNVKVQFNDVVGYAGIKNILQEELNYILLTKENKEEMKNFSIAPKRGTLLYGPPGNGKTTFAEALAGEGNFYYIKVLSKDFSGYSSIDTLKQLEIIFENTAKLSKMTNKKGVVLFFDEIDTLISIGMEATVRGTLLNFLEDKKGIKSDDSKIILIAATNFKELLDEASIREGRFDSKLEVGYPSKEDAILMIKKFFEDDDTLDISEIDITFYENRYEELVIKKEKEIERFNMKIKDERFHKFFEGIPTVELKNIKEEVKRDAFLNKNRIRDNKILISSRYK